MGINIWNWGEIDKGVREKILNRAQNNIDAVMDAVRPIITAVQQRGDPALLQFTKEFDKTEVKGGLRVTEAEFAEARESLDPDLVKAIRSCAGYVRKHHMQQMAHVKPLWFEEVQPGVYAGEKITPVDSVGLYVPRGKGAFPSVMYMLCLPAVVAGVKKIVVVTPPTPEGGVDAASLVAADACGVREVYKVGGAQAIAALAFGTQTIPRVTMVQGPGSPYVAAAKRVLSGVFDTGMAAGPSEALILADGSADPQNTALDMINEAEHGPDSASLLVTPDAALAKKVASLLPSIITALPPPRRAYCETVFATYGGIILARDMREAIDITNAYAVEHMLLKVKDSDVATILSQIKNAGEILIGESTPIVLGNFGVGVNAVLPTGGHARTQSCTSVWSFLKRTSLALATKQGYMALKDPVVMLAHYEGFPGHARVLEDRNEAVLKDTPPSGLPLPVKSG